MIPKLAHRIYLDEPVPQAFEPFWERMAELHPDWTLKTWDDSTALGWMRCQETFDQAQTWAGKSDVLRYEILAAYGGVYLDCDVEPLRAFDELRGGPAFAGWEDERLLCPTVMGSEPGDPAIEELLDALPAWAHRYRKAPPNRQTGPYFLTSQWERRIDVRLLEPDAFYPVHWSEKAKLGGPYPPASYAVHHWNAGWLPNGPPQRVPAGG